MVKLFSQAYGWILLDLLADHSHGIYTQAFILTYDSIGEESLLIWFIEAYNFAKSTSIPFNYTFFE